MPTVMMKPTILLLLLLVILTVNTLTIIADIPVHCVHNNIGNSEWKLFISRPLYTLREHDTFDTIQSRQDIPLNCSRFSRQDLDIASIRQVSLELPTHVIKVDNEIIGKWTMVYDQGFEMNFNHENLIPELSDMSMFAFSMFERLKNDSELIRSKCHETFVGNYRKSSVLPNGNIVTKYGCYYGLKTNPKPSDIKVSLPINTLLYKYYDPKSHGKGLNVNDEKPLSDSEMGVDLRLMRTSDPNQKFKSDRNLIDWINTQADDLGWSATDYPHFEEMTNEQVETLTSGNRAIHMDKSDLQNRELSDEEDMELSDYHQEEPQPEIELPDNFDWRNVSGENYVPDVKNQKACGSCFAFAAITAIESRIRIQTKNQLKPLLAVQDVVSCSPYAQKCHGGIPYAIGRHLKDFTLVPETCFPYQANEHVPCSAKCKNPAYVVKVKNYKYVGGFYGAANEEEMRREIFLHGPVSVSYLIYPDFK